jgi:hypothetical protein
MLCLLFIGKKKNERGINKRDSCFFFPQGQTHLADCAEQDF